MAIVKIQEIMKQLELAIVEIQNIMKTQNAIIRPNKN